MMVRVKEEQPVEGRKICRPPYVPKYNPDHYKTAPWQSMLYHIRYDTDFERFYRDRISLWKCLGDYGKGQCPFCDAQTFCADLRTGKARCRNCSWRGDPVAFTQRHLHVSLPVAIATVFVAKGVAL